jgi:hypothetical protein
VGVNYFMTGTDFLTTTFLSRYHLTEVRATVQTQLVEMAAVGTPIVRTPMWFASDGPADPPEWFIAFPPSGQQLVNIINVGADVLSTGMRWDISFGWEGCASLSGALTCGLTEEQQYVRIEQTLDSVIGLFNTSFHPRRAYLYIEISLTPTRASAFLIRMWPRFRTLCIAAGIIPSIYGHSATPMADVITFMTANSLVLPDRAEMSLYLDVPPPLSPLTEVTDEIDILRTAGIERIAIAETFYPVDSAERASWGAKFVQIPALEEVLFWPGTSDPDYTSIPPFDLIPYGRPAGTVTTTGAMVAGQVALISGETTLTGDTGLLFDTATDVLMVGGRHVQTREDTNLTYGATISVPDVAVADWFVIPVTDASAHTLPAPTNGYAGAEIHLSFTNTSGGAIATCTFNAVYRHAGYVAPPNGSFASAAFKSNGSNWYQMSPWTTAVL